MATLIPPTDHPNVVLIGAGIMSATLAVILKEQEREGSIDISKALQAESILFKETPAHFIV